MKKEKSKKIFLFFVLFLVLINLVLIVLISAQNEAETVNPTTSESFFRRWVFSRLGDTDAKLLLWLMVFAIIFVLLYSLTDQIGMSILLSIPSSFILVAYVTPQSIIGIFKTYETLPLAVATFFPLLILFGFTYLSAVKGNRTLITMQWLLWLVYALINSIKIVLLLYVYFEGEGYENFLQVVKLPGANESFWFWTSMILTTSIAWIMVSGSGKFMNWVVLKTAGLEDVAAKKRFKEASNALRNLAQLEREASK